MKKKMTTRRNPRYTIINFQKHLRNFQTIKPDGTRADFCRTWKISKEEYELRKDELKFEWHNLYEFDGYSEGRGSRNKIIRKEYKGKPGPKPKPKPNNKDRPMVFSDEEQPKVFTLEQPNDEITRKILGVKQTNEDDMTMFVLTKNSKIMDDIVSRFMGGSANG